MPTNLNFVRAASCQICDFWESLAVPSIPPHFSELLERYGVTGCATDSFAWIFTPLVHFFVFTMWSGGASLHRVEVHMSGLWGGFLHALFFALPVRLTRFHQDLGWLSCLRSPTFRHMYMWHVFHRTLRPALFFIVIPYVIGAFFSLIECASCHRYLEPNGFSAPILLYFVHHWWRGSGTALSSLTHSSSED